MPESVEEVWLQPFCPGRDIDRVSAWLRKPHVVRWWGDPQEQLPAVMERPIGGDDALIIADRVPVGYVRWQQTSRAELEAAGLHEIPEGSIDIDIAIGEADYLGCGVGSRALHLVLQRLETEKFSTLVMMTTSVENGIAIRACEKAGFRRRRTFDDPEYGRCWLLVHEATRQRAPAASAPV